MWPLYNRDMKKFFAIYFGMNLLVSCGSLFKPAPTHPDIKKFKLAGRWEDGRDDLVFTCSGTVDLNAPSTKELFKVDRLQGDLKSIDGNRMEVWALGTHVMNDFDSPRPMKVIPTSWRGTYAYEMKLNGKTWYKKDLEDCP